MEWLGVLGAAALVLLGVLLRGLFGKSTEQKGAGDSVSARAKEILNEHVEEVQKAQDDYAKAMADTPDARVDAVLKWFRKRTGDGSGG